MVKIISIGGIETEVECIGCALQKGLIKSVGDFILETKHFIVSQDYEVPIAGFLVLASKRHISSILDFTSDEENEFFELMKKIRLSLKEVLGIKYVMQFCNESKIISTRNPSHFHYCFLPKDGFESKTLNETLKYAREHMNTEKNIIKIKETNSKLKNYFANL